MLKVTDIEKLAKECNLEVNVDLEFAMTRYGCEPVFL